MSMRMAWVGGAVVVWGEAAGSIVWRLEPGEIPPASYEADVRAAGLLHDVPLRDVNQALRSVKRAGPRQHEEATGGSQAERRDAPPATTPPVAAEPDFIGEEP